MSEYKKGAPPRKVINQKQFETLCQLDCTQREIEAILDTDIKTIDRWCKTNYNAPFIEVFEAKRCIGNASLRRKQWEKAMTGAEKTLMHLCINRLGQKSSHTIEIQNSLKELSDEELLELAPQVLKRKGPKIPLKEE